ncbi:hypothetical protein RI129_003269 [Pyrocoelia pectoralis]|uniref:DDE Tnp4 domain-containing protein n=1 Tax=Pyrocoelia pectoralis TaxID=417401 RepID=A0AAN7ZMX0_9COLE
MRVFQRRSSIPGIIGCTDESRVKIIASKDSPNSDLNRKKFHSVLLQGVCNEKKLFLDTYAGEPGPLHDYNLYQKFDLAERITTRSVTFYNNGYLIGDLAYKLSIIIAGFKNFGNITRREVNFNKKLNLCRVEIENAFALLKGRFRRLKFMETVRLDFISLFIITSTILHHVFILNDDLPHDIVNLNDEVREVRRNDVNDVGVNNEGVDNNAEQKRRNILYNLPLD